jgi:hypothetical protein
MRSVKVMSKRMVCVVEYGRDGDFEDCDGRWC